MRPQAAVLFTWVFWTALGVFFAITTSLTYVSQGNPPLWGRVLAASLAQWWIWAALTPAVVWIARRAPLDRSPGTRVPLHLAAGVIVAVVKVQIEGLVRTWLFGVRPYVLINNLGLQVLIYFAIVGATIAVDRYAHNRARAAEAEAQLGQAQLDLLTAQLRPHFLFNALNTIAELVHESPDLADATIGRLGALLRASLDAGRRPMLTLAEELALVESYLAIQQARFGERLHVSIVSPADCADALVPGLLLQPIVENAVQHGLSTRPDGGSVRVAAAREETQLHLTVRDDGSGVAPDIREGVGLSNTRARLASLYGHTASLSISGHPEGGTLAEIVLPFTAARKTSR